MEPTVLTLLAVAASLVLVVLAYQTGRRRGEGLGREQVERLDANRRLQEAVVALTLGDRSEALTCLMDATRADVRQVEPYIALGDLVREAGNADQARYVHQLLLVRPDLVDAQRTRVQISLAGDWLVLGRRSDAIRCLQEGLRYSPNHLPSLRLLLRLFEEAENWKGAQMILARVERVTALPLPVPRAYLTARVAAAEEVKGNQREALRLYREALAGFPCCVPAAVGAGRLWVALGKHPKAVRMWQQVVHEAPGLAPLLRAAYADRPEVAASLAPVFATTTVGGGSQSRTAEDGKTGGELPRTVPCGDCGETVELVDRCSHCGAWHGPYAGLARAATPGPSASDSRRSPALLATG